MHVLEAIAEHQPVGLTALCAATGEDKSALQRTLATLNEAGWIHRVGAATPQWELATKPLVMLGRVRKSASIASRARELLGPLRDATGETVHLSLLDGPTLVVADVAESSQIVRTALPIGQIHPLETSAAGRVIMSHLSPAERRDRAASPDKLLPDVEFEEIRQLGWASNTGAVLEGSNSVGAAVLDLDGAPVGAIVISAPATRLPEEKCAEYGTALLAATAQLTGHR
ncbi:IclR family transcriptional regulator [Dietzia kunjamensis]|nr:IclR family transcriptional regulator [Dietzia kunjamensis]